MSEFIENLKIDYPFVAKAEEISAQLPKIVSDILETIYAKQKASERQLALIEKMVRQYEVAEMGNAAGYFGKVGEKASVVVEIVERKCIGQVVPPGWNSSWRSGYNRKFPNKYLVKMKAGGGEILCWFSASEQASQMEPGQKIAVKFKIKLHEDYQGAMQTVVTHVKEEVPKDLVG